MGRAVVASNGESPLDRFRTDLSWILSSTLHTAVAGLLAGKPIDSDEDAITITFTGTSSSGDVVEIIARESDARERLRLVVRPATKDQLRGLGIRDRHHDKHVYEPPPPGSFVTEIDDAGGTIVRWELFNCFVIDVEALPPPAAQVPDQKD